MIFHPITYDEPVFRPPAEAFSAIIQATIGCSWNKCAFCEMYTSKQFRVRGWERVKSDINYLAGLNRGVKKVFLADGNAFVLSARKLFPILQEIYKSFGKMQRISSYALPKDILQKSDKELLELRQLGLKLLYIGIESGNDHLLEIVGKGESHQSTVEGIIKAHEAGIDTSIMVINGLGGKQHSQQHAIDSARLINSINPKFLSALTLSMPMGEEHYKKRLKGSYERQTIYELAAELRLFIEHLDNINSIFRSDHVSNNLVLKGILSRDKEKLISQIDFAMQQIDPDEYPSCSPFL